MPKTPTSPSEPRRAHRKAAGGASGGGGDYSNALNCSGVSPAILAIPPIVVAFISTCRGICTDTLPLRMMMCPL